jgi:transketolase
VFDALPKYKPGDAAAATRKLSQECLNAIAPNFPELIGMNNAHHCIAT